eukprot:15434434-Alexandrium_andersonii.AAC.1
MEGLGFATAQMRARGSKARYDSHPTTQDTVGNCSKSCAALSRAGQWSPQWVAINLLVVAPWLASGRGTGAIRMRP